MNDLWFESELVCCVCKTNLLRDNHNRLNCVNECCDAGYTDSNILYVLPKESILKQKYDKIFEAWKIIQNHAVPNYEKDPVNHLAIKGNPREKYYDQFGDFCNLSGKVLDIGCGPSGKKPVYLKKAALIVGVEPILGQLPKEIPFCNAIGEFLPFPDGYFDHVTMNSVIDHVFNPDLVVLEAIRVLTPGGKLHVCVNMSQRYKKNTKTIIKNMLPKIISHSLKKVIYKFRNIPFDVPYESEDRCHMKYFNAQIMHSLFSRLNLDVVNETTVPFNEMGGILGFFSIQKPS